MADNACSVTVVGSRSRVDLLLPGSLPIAELVWDLVDLLAEPEVEGRVPRWGFVRTGGRVLSGERGLAEQGVTDGSMLFLRDLARPPEPPAIDDYAEAVALTVDARGGRWIAAAREGVLLAVAVAWVLVASALALQLDDVAARTATALCAAAFLVLGGAVVARRWHRGGVGAALALSSLPLWAVGGMGAGMVAGLSGPPLYPAVAGFAAFGALCALLAGEAAGAPVAGALTLEDGAPVETGLPERPLRSQWRLAAGPQRPAASLPFAPARLGERRQQLLDWNVVGRRQRRATTRRFDGDRDHHASGSTSPPRDEA